MLEYLEPFSSVQTIIILVCTQISSDSFKSMITYKLLTYRSHMHNHFIVYKQISTGLFKNAMYKLCLQIIYDMYKEDLA